MNSQKIRWVPNLVYIKNIFIFTSSIYFQEQKKMNIKSHTCKEGGNIPRDFCLAFIDELEKQLFIKKTAEVGQ